MMNYRKSKHVPHGVTLLEVVTALSLAATVMTSSFVVLRSSYAAWQAHEVDLDRAANTTAVLRHLVRHARQAESVSAISASTDTSGGLTIVNSDGTTLRWDHSGTGVTLSVNGAAAQPLADDIQSLTFEGYRADGVTPTNEPEEVHAFRSAVTISLPTGGVRTVSSYAWVRSW